MSGYLLLLGSFVLVVFRACGTSAVSHYWDLSLGWSSVSLLRGREMVFFMTFSGIGWALYPYLGIVLDLNRRPLLVDVCSFLAALVPLHPMRGLRCRTGLPTLWRAHVLLHLCMGFSCRDPFVYPS